VLNEKRVEKKHLGIKRCERRKSERGKGVETSILLKVTFETDKINYKRDQRKIIQSYRRSLAVAEVGGSDSFFESICSFSELEHGCQNEKVRKKVSNTNPNQCFSSGMFGGSLTSGELWRASN
jgi:hypothetical protein